MHDFNIIQLIAIWAMPVIFAVTVHEASHGIVANYYGDATAKMLGRLTLSPHKHIDPLGTIILPAVLLFMGTPFIFGWAKPVPITARNLKNPKRDMAIIALAGPVSNLIMALIWAVLAKIATLLGNIESIHWLSYPLYLMGIAGVQINLILALLNLLPLPPLDGSRVLSNFLKGKIAVIYDQIEPYGFFIIIALLFTGVLSKVLLPLFLYSFYFIKTVFGI